MKTLKLTRLAIYGTPHSEIAFTYRGAAQRPRMDAREFGGISEAVTALARDCGFTHFRYINAETKRDEKHPIPAYPLSNATHSQIVAGMARAFFLSAFSEQCDEAGHGRRFSGRDYAEELPAIIDSAALHAAETLANDMANANYPGWTANPRKIPGFPIVALFLRALASQTSGERLTPALFGHYAAMQSLGHGVGLFDYGVKSVAVPYVAFGSYSLACDYWHETENGAPVYRSATHDKKPAILDTGRNVYLTGYASQIEAMNAALTLNARHYGIKGH